MKPDIEAVAYRILNLLMRIITLVCRFALVLLLAKFLAPESVGIYGLLFVCINFGLMLAGLDFYAFSNRELVDANSLEASKIVLNQLTLYAVVYVMALPISLAVFKVGLLPMEFLGLFLSILVVEHLSYESYRIFVAYRRPIAATTIAFIRSGLWVLVLFLVFIWREELRSIETLLWLWLIGSTLSLLLAWRILRRAGLSFQGANIDPEWIARGVKVAFPYLLGTLALRSIFTLDRFFVEVLSNIALVGVYSFYIGMCTALLSLFEASTSSFFYPKLISAAKYREEGDFSKTLSQFYKQSIITAVGLAAAIYIFSVPLVQFVGREIYLENTHILKLLLIAFSIYVVSMVPHFGLYALKSDFALLKSQLIGLFLFLVCMIFFLAFDVRMEAVPYSMIIAFAFMLVLKVYFLSREKDYYFVATC